MVVFSIGLLLVIVSLVCLIAGRFVELPEDKHVFFGVSGGTFFVAIILFIVSCMKPIPTGHTGIVTTFGRVEDYTYEAGIHFDLPWRKVIKMDNRTQKEQIELSCFSSDIQETTVIYTVNFQIDKQNAQKIYKNIGKDYYEKVVQPKILESVKSVFAQYNAESLVEKRGLLSTEIEKVLSEAVSAYDIQIVSTSIEDIDFTDTFTNAVEAKQVAEQNKLRAKTEQEQKVIEANANAERIKIDAEANAQAQIIAAQADAEVAKIGADASEYQGIKDAAIMSNLGEMLTKYPQLIDYYRVTGWDGKLPTTYFGDDGQSVLYNVTK